MNREQRTASGRCTQLVVLKRNAQDADVVLHAQHLGGDLLAAITALVPGKALTRLTWS